MSIRDSHSENADISTAYSSHAKVPTIWTFVAADLASFGMLFAVFAVERAAQPHLFARSSILLDDKAGLANTLILITSSWVAALAVAAARRGQIIRVRRLLSLAIGLGTAFTIIKISEYTAKIGQGITPLTNDFFTYYFILTGVHFFHLIIGMIVLTGLAAGALNRGTIDKRYLGWLESGAIYWHMVDLLWVFLFPMLYLTGRM
jgi:nitric oxide reductase NorE protein